MEDLRERLRAAKQKAQFPARKSSEANLSSQSVNVVPKKSPYPAVPSTPYVPGTATRARKEKEERERAQATAKRSPYPGRAIDSSSTLSKDDTAVGASTSRNNLFASPEPPYQIPEMMIMGTLARPPTPPAMRDNASFSGSSVDSRSPLTPTSSNISPPNRRPLSISSSYLNKATPPNHPLPQPAYLQVPSNLFGRRTHSHTPTQRPRTAPMAVGASPSNDTHALPDSSESSHYTTSGSSSHDESTSKHSTSSHAASSFNTVTRDRSWDPSYGVHTLARTGARNAEAPPQSIPKQQRSVDNFSGSQHHRYPPPTSQEPPTASLPAVPFPPAVAGTAVQLHNQIHAKQQFQGRHESLMKKDQLYGHPTSSQLRYEAPPPAYQTLETLDDDLDFPSPPPTDSRGFAVQAQEIPIHQHYFASRQIAGSAGSKSLIRSSVQSSFLDLN